MRIPAVFGLLLAATAVTPAVAQTESDTPAPATEPAAGAAGAEPRFDQLDQDGDGFLTPEELLNEAELAAIQEELDSDADGRISRTEFAALETGETGTGAADRPGAAGEPDYDWTDDQQGQQQTAGETTGALNELAGEQDQLSRFVEAVQRTGMADALRGDTQYTIFAPTNEAFEDYGRNLEDLTQDELVNVLRAHIVADDVDPEMAKRISEARTIGGGSVRLATEDGDTLQVGDAEVVTSNIQKGNLRIYAINGVLDPGARLTAGTEGQAAGAGDQPQGAADQATGAGERVAGTDDERLKNLREKTVSVEELLGADVNRLGNPLGNVSDLILNEQGTAVEYVLYEVPYPYTLYGENKGFAAYDNVSVEPLESFGEYVRFDDDAAARAPEELTLTRAEADHRLVSNLVGNQVSFSGGAEIREVEDILIDRQTGKIKAYVVNANPDAWFNDEPRVIPPDQIQVTEEGNVTTQAEFAALESLESVE